jgi:hypothetical protein
MIAFALVGLLAMAGPDAGATQRVALADLTLEDVPLSEAQDVVEQVEAALGRGRYEIVRIHDACADAKCWSEAGERVDAAYVVHPRLRRVAPDHTIAITIIDVRRGSVLSDANGTCDLCGHAELVDLASDLGERTRRRLDQLTGGPAVVSLGSTPRGATVRVDGEIVGTTPLEHTIPPGRHEIRVELDGYQPVVRTTDVVGGTREAIAFELVPRPTVVAAAQQKEMKRSRAFVGAGASLLVVGLAGVGVGAALLAIHATPIEGDCSSDNIDPDGDCRFLHDTRGGGIAALALGGAGLVTGAVLLGVGLRRRGSNVRASATPRSLALEVRF